MPKLSFTEEEINLFVSELKKQLIPELRKELETSNSLPPLLTRRQFMELADISHTKANQLFNTRGFPVTRKLGNPRVKTDRFFEWLDEDINNKKIL